MKRFLVQFFPFRYYFDFFFVFEFEIDWSDFQGPIVLLSAFLLENPLFYPGPVHSIGLCHLSG